MKYADLPKQRLNHLVKPEGLTLEEWQVMLRMQQAQREALEVECVSERYNPGEYRVRSPKSGGVYKVVYRGPKSPWNYCDCMDFKTSQLGTCKHIEAVRQWIADHHKRIHWDLPSYTSVYLSYRGNQRQVKIRIGTTREQDFRALVAGYFDELGGLMPHAYACFGDFLAAARALDAGFRCYADARDFVVEQREAIARRKVVEEKYTDEALDNLLHTTLYPYQKEGVRFAARAGRVIMADEMGLGKTVQAIAAAELLRREGFVGSILVVCPTSLVYQWKQEIKRFTDAADSYRIASFNRITTPMTCDLLILDEVQRLKNWNTQAAKAVRRISSRYAFVLSGTPLENCLEDLYSVVELVDQFLLSPFYLFRDRYILTDASGRTIGYRNLSEISQRLHDVMLRRRKTDVALQLPSRIDKNLLVSMTHEQREAHDRLKGQTARLVTKWHRQHFLSDMDRKQLLLTLSQMRMVCDSLYVLDERSRFDTKVEEVMNILDKCGVTVKDSVFPRSKVVIFSQWERMTRLVAEEMERSGIEFVYLHGNVPLKQREERIQTFQTDPEVRVFLSTDTGATGLNLQVANVVINLDLPWNPAVLEQRIGRIHRIGQERGIEVINLIAVSTIEEDMLSRLRFKAALFEGVLDGGDDAVFLSSDRFDSLLSELAGYIGEGAQQESPSTTPPVKEENGWLEEALSPTAELPSPVEGGGNESVEPGYLKSLAQLLLADEPTRKKVAALLTQLAKEA